MLNTTLVYIEKDSKYLMLHRTKKPNDLNRDKWIGIGGKFEENESPEECAAREVKEETGLSLKSLEFRGIVTFVSDTSNCEYMHIFWTDDFSGTAFGRDGCVEGELEWIEKSKMNEIPHWKGDEIFLNLLEMKVPFFSLKLVYEKGELLEAVLNGKKLDLKKI